MPRLAGCRYTWQEVELGPSDEEAKSRLGDAAKEALKEQLVRSRCCCRCCYCMRLFIRIAERPLPGCTRPCACRDPSCCRCRLWPPATTLPPRIPPRASLPQVTKQQLFECGEGEFFEWCGLVVSKDVWRKKEIRSHTKQVYQQRK